MKRTFHIYLNQQYIETIQANDLNHAAALARNMGLKFDAISTVFHPPRRTPGEFLDDAIDNTRETSSKVLPLAKAKASSFLSWAGHGLSSLSSKINPPRNNAG